MKNIKLLGSAMLVSLALFSQSSLAKEYKIGASLLTQQHPGDAANLLI
ncbi:hypothetical protein [Escherichia coli]|nr:hypothetical protein [Escherichia coli]